VSRGDGDVDATDQTAFNAAYPSEAGDEEYDRNCDADPAVDSAAAVVRPACSASAGEARSALDTAPSRKAAATQSVGGQSLR